MLAQAVAPRVIMEMLGHSQISITMNLYSHVTVELSSEAADRVQNLLWPVRKPLRLPARLPSASLSRQTRRPRPAKAP